MGDGRRTLQHSGFFAWRTPLLPFTEAMALSEGLAAPAAGDDELGTAVAADRAEVRRRLRRLLASAEVREAIFLASPDLDDAVNEWLDDPDADGYGGVVGAVLRYLTRMATRPTPFGTFAGCSTGTVGDGPTALRLASRQQHRRSTRLDLGYLTDIAEAVAADPEVRQELRFRTNSSLYRVSDAVRYVECRTGGSSRSHHLVSLPATDALDAALASATDGATIAELAAAVAATGANHDAAATYAERLVDRQVVVAEELGVAITGPDPLAPLLDGLQRHVQTKQLGDTLDRVTTTLAEIDSAGVGASPTRYRAMAAELEEAPVEREQGRLFQVDLAIQAERANLSDAVVAELRRAVDLLHRFARTEGETELSRFREAFVRRYEDAAVPLVEALDEERGIGFGASDPAPLLRDIDFPSSPEEHVRWGHREQWLLQQLLDHDGDPTRELVLSRADLDVLSDDDPPPPLPDALAVKGTLAGTPEQLAEDRFQFVVQGIGGPSGANLLGRFCGADPDLERGVQRHLRAEEAADPDAVFAEVVHLPEGRVGNVLARPVLRDAEIAYLGRSGAADAARLPVTDLLVAVQGESIQLWSARLGRRIVPRLTTAHNFSGPTSLPLYRFLCALQQAGTAARLGWSWGPLATAPFLPRVRYGRLVLAVARWTLDEDELGDLGTPSGADAVRTVRRLRDRRRLPRWVRLVDGDNRLLVDLENVVAVESLLGLLRGRSSAVLEELFPSTERLGVEGPDGAHAHEVVVPLVRGDVAEQPSRRQPPPATSHLVPPASRWLFAKMYCGSAVADQLLREVVAPTMRDLVDRGDGERWFFIRYGDPDWHLRVRINGDPTWLQSDAWPRLSAALRPWLGDERVWRLSLDTYRPERRRYGGPEGMAIAERLFHVDSTVAAGIVARLSRGDVGRTERWQLALRGTDLLLRGLGLDLAARRDLAQRRRDAFRTERHLEGGAARAPIGQRYRDEQPALTDLLAATWDDDHPLAPGFELLDHLEGPAQQAGGQLRELESADGLAVPLAQIAGSLCHMHANRLLRASHRRQEAVLWDFLVRLYERQFHLRHDRREV